MQTSTKQRLERLGLCLYVHSLAVVEMNLKIGQADVQQAAPTQDFNEYAVKLLVALLKQVLGITGRAIGLIPPA